jgi:hypothetical protein
MGGGFGERLLLQMRSKIICQWLRLYLHKRLWLLLPILDTEKQFIHPILQVIGDGYM